MKRASILLMAAMATGGAGASWACGACVEDRVAATYDHIVIDTATVRHDQVVFVAIDGAVNASKVNARIVTALPKVRGVRAGTLRTSRSPPAFSFALDANQTPEVAVAGFRKAIGDPAARLTVVRIMSDGLLHEPK